MITRYRNGHAAQLKDGHHKFHLIRQSCKDYLKKNKTKKKKHLWSFFDKSGQNNREEERLLKLFQQNNRSESRLEFLSHLL